MLLTNQPATATSQSVNQGMPSPTGETMEENPNKLITYLHQLAGNGEVEVCVIIKDHCYARPWNWKPENNYVKPVKKLFFSKVSSGYSKDHQDEFVNVDENNSEACAPPYDLAKMKQSMDEFQRVANFVKPEDTDDWEEKIDKILWSPVQARIFSRVVRILNSERVTRLAKANSLHEPILRRTSIDTTAKKFRESLASANWDWRITQWLHSLLFDYLPQDYLAIYLDILQTLRQKIPQLIDKMVAVQPNVNAKNPSSVAWETLGPLLKKSWDPVGPILNANKPKKLPGNPILIVVPSGLSSNVSSRHHKWITQLGHLGTVLTVTPHAALTANRLTVMAGMEQLIQATRAKIQDARSDYPSRPIVLIGFNSGAGLACQIAQMEHITAIVCLGFPFSTVDGRRGTPEDTILDVRSPVMFVIGQHSTISRVDDIEDLRERMQVATSLVVVGSADDHLRVSTSKKIAEKISQGMVDRCILDEIADFVGGILMQPHPMPLRSIGRKTEPRKRKNSTSSSEVSETQSPSLKKLRPQSPQVNSVAGNNPSITTNVLPKGTLVALTGTTATQTPRRRSRTYAAAQTAQAPSIENSTGGITLNFGSFASLSSPVGPIRFEPSSISLQTPGKSGNTIKTTNAFIKVSKNNQVNIGGPQNVAKIKMIMPTATTKKVSQRSPNIKPNEVNLVNVLAPSNAPIKINPTAAGGLTPANIVTAINNAKTQSNPTTIKSPSIMLTSKVASLTTSTATTATTKVADISTMAANRKPVQTLSSRPPPPLVKSSRPPSKSLHSPKPPAEQNHSMEDLGNILDIPIIIAKEGESLEHLQPDKMPKLLLIGSPGAKTESPVKYTKFIIAKRTDEADANKGAPVILTKNRRPTGKLLVVNSKIEDHSTKQIADILKMQSDYLKNSN